MALGRRTKLRLAGVALLQAALFGALAMLVVDALPLRISAGEGSTVGAESFEDVTGGLTELRLSLSLDTIDGMVGMDDAARRSWMASSAPRRHVDPDTGALIEDDDPLPRPKSWPIEGRFGLLARPGIALATVCGLDVFEQELESSIYGQLTPLTVRVAAAPISLLLALLAGCLPVIVFAGAFPSRTRLGRGVAALGIGLVASILCLTIWLPLAGTAVPELDPEWREWTAAMVDAGRMNPSVLFSGANVRGVLMAAATVAMGSFVGGLIARRSTAL